MNVARLFKRSLRISSVFRPTNILPTTFMRNIHLDGGKKLGSFYSIRSLSSDKTKQVEMKLADIGEGIAEVEIKKWYVKVGDSVKEYDLLCDAKSDKASVSITSRFTGKITKINFDENEMAKVGQSLIEFQVKSLEDEPQEVGNSNIPENKVVSTNGTSEASVPSRKPLASPAVRKFALDNKINLDEIIPSEDRRIISIHDVNRHIDKRKTQHTVNGPDEVIELSGNHRVMFRTMTESQKIPHFVYSDEVDVSFLINYLRETKLSKTPSSSTQFSLLGFTIKALSMALKDFPKLNSSIISCDKNPAIALKKSHNIGIAVDTPLGLLVPVLKEVENKTTVEITAEIQNLVILARQDKLNSSQIEGGTFTISNIGTVGGISFHPLILHPQVAILATGKIMTKKSCNDTNIHILPLTLAADHRIIDGATGGKFVNRFSEYLKNPMSLLALLK